MFPYFIFKNKDSREYNMYISLMPPVSTLDNDVELVEVPGRDGYLTLDQGRKTTIEKSITATIFPADNIENIKNWLKGSGRLILSNDPGVYYNARINSIREYFGVKNEKTIELTFICQPWAYLLSGDNVINITTKNTKINNPEELSKPLIKIYGTGNVDLIINNDIHKFNINGYVTVDSELMESYKDNILATFIGKFPVLAMGENNISWDGTVTKIEVVPRWRK